MANDELEAIFELGEEQEFDCEFKIDATTFDYSALDNKPQINGETLEGNKLSSDLHLASEQGLLDEIENRQNADIEFANNLYELDSKVDGINTNLTQQIEETQQDVNDKYNELIRDIDDLTDVVEEDYNTLNQRITDVADDLQQTIEENVVALQQEDTALQNQINAHSTTLTAYDARITNNSNVIAQEIIDRQNADDTLQDQIDNLKARGRFLSLWNATTGLAETNPEIDPYPYNTGDYFIVGTVGEVNYKPTGTQYVIGQPSTAIETEELASEDVYYFDGQVWHLQVNHGKTVSFGNLAGQPSDNTALKNALDGKADDNSVIHTTGDETKTGTLTISSNTSKAFEVYSSTGGGYLYVTRGGTAPVSMAIKSGTSGGTFGTTTNHQFQFRTNDISRMVIGIDGSVKLAQDVNVNSNDRQVATTKWANDKLATKQNITDDNLVTTDKTVVGAVNELDAKIKEIELYKTPNVLIQGEPTINNGQVTGFSKTNYLILPFEFNVGERAFELTYAFRTGSDVTTAQNLFGSKFSIASYISGGKLTIRISSNGTSWDILDLITSLNIQANTTYYIKIIFNRLGYTIKYSADGVEYSEIGSIVDTRPPFAGDVYIGIGNNTNNPFLGMINLHKWELKYNNSVFWEGMDDAGLATRADISLSNLDEQGEARFEAKQDVIDDLGTIRTNASTGAGLAPQVAVNTQRIEDLTVAKFPNVVIIGTPHIEGGQVSNYSDTNYLQFPFIDISRGQPFDIYFSFTTSNDVTNQQNILDSYFGIALAIQNGKGIMALSSNGTGWDIGTSTGTNTLLPNTTYYVKYSWTGTAYSAALSTDDQVYVPDMNLTSSLSPHKTTIFIGGSPNLFGAGTAHPFKGTINFNKSKVVVNGITVWEGMADVGLASRANVSLNNLDEVGQSKLGTRVIIRSW